MDDTTVSVIFYVFLQKMVNLCVRLQRFNSRAAIIRPTSAAKGLVYTENKQESRCNSRHCTAGLGCRDYMIISEGSGKP